ncbi:MAG: hypothetical protein AB7T31_06655 [Gemmatimonadales bacterium]
MTSSRLARMVLVSGSLLAAAAPASAQSLFNAAGIGLPMEALDGRARALGSLGIGLPGSGGLLPADPAASARLLVPGGLISAQPTWVELRRSGGGTTTFQGNRFPLLAAGYPFAGGMATLQATSVLDQRFRGERPVTVDLLGTPSEAVDAFEQDGSVAMLAAGYSHLITPAVAVGFSVGRYSGTVVRSLVREFADSAAAGRPVPYATSGTWNYQGYQVTLGGSADVGGLFRVAASATASTELKAIATSRTAGGDRSFAMPLQLRVGASGQLAPGLLLSASAARADWAATATDLGGGAEAGATLAYGAGLELSNVRFLGRSAPLRLGFRRTDLPFSLEAGDANEQVLTGGVGFALNQTNDVVLASVDLGLEKGRRIGGTYHEDFWRATLSLRLLGY